MRGRGGGYRKEGAIVLNCCGVDNGSVAGRNNHKYYTSNGMCVVSRFKVISPLPLLADVHAQTNN